MWSFILFADLFQTKPLQKAAATCRIDVGLVFRVRRSAVNIHPFNDTEAPQRIKENTISIMNDNPDLQSICRHFQGKKSSWLWRSFTKKGRIMNEIYTISYLFLLHRWIDLYIFFKKINCLFKCLIFINLFNYYNYTILLKFSFLTPERWNIAFTCFSNLVISSLFPLKSNYLHTFKNWLKYYSNSKNTFFWYFLSASLSLSLSLIIHVYIKGLMYLIFHYCRSVSFVEGTTKSSI